MSPCKEEKCARTLIDANQYMNRLIRYEERLKKVIADMDQLRIEYKKTTAENGKLTAENEMLRADVQNLSRENEMQKTELARKVKIFR
jgi:regulator of replication initiation timing